MCERRDFLFPELVPDIYQNEHKVLAPKFNSYFPTAMLSVTQMIFLTVFDIAYFRRCLGSTGI